MSRVARQPHSISNSSSSTPPQSPSKHSQGPQNVLPPRQGCALNLPGHHIGHADPDEQVRKAPKPATFPASKTNQTANTLFHPATDLSKSRNNQAHPPQCSHPDPSPPSSPRQPASNPSRTLGARLSSPITTATTSAFSPMSSLLSQKTPSQSRSFSASASLGVRRVTFRPSRRVQKRRHGYLARKKDRNGRKTLIRRTLKGRKELSW
ncbi:Ribosomal protein L34 [Penicillium cf. griseofulvum]|nr:Ribosomal protein L34 [Penicillium cf. griseofulvum]